MTRDCTTARIKRADLVGLLDTMTSFERQMVTARMPLIRAEDLQAAPTTVEEDEEITAPVHTIWTGPTQINVRFRRPRVKTPALTVPAPVTTPGSSDVTLIGVICTLSLSLCAALAWLG
jgi:hypothetical protein